MAVRKPVDVVRYAVIGAGWFGQEAVLPAFKRASANSTLAAIISGDPAKREALSAAYGVPSHPYIDMDRVFAQDIDAIYIVTPNTEHFEPVQIAARHGVHVLCEKPLAENTAAAQLILDTCSAAQVKLMTAYRLHFEKANLTAIEHVQVGKIGEPRLMLATNTQMVSDADNTRLDPDLAGHPLLDLGVYCINAARYLFRDEPIEVLGYDAGRRGNKSGGVPDLVCAMLKFSDQRMAQFSCGFGQAKVSNFQIIGTHGHLRLNPAFAYIGEKTITLIAGDTSDVETFPASDQIAGEIEYFSDFILHDTTPGPDGDEALIDMRIMDAILTSIRDGRAVPLPPADVQQRPDLSQVKTKKASRRPKLVKVKPPTND